MFAELGIGLSKFPALHGSTDVVGRLTLEAAQALDLPAGIPVVAGGGSCASAAAAFRFGCYLLLDADYLIRRVVRSQIQSTSLLFGCAAVGMVPL